jgi:hypothetical protein
MDPQLTEIYVRTLIPVLILVVLVWLKQWQTLLGFSILSASYGLFILTAYDVGYMTGTLPPGPEIHISTRGTVAYAFLRAIFILLLAIFAWLQKEGRHY